MLEFIRKLFGLLRAPDLRVRVVDLQTNSEAWGTVRKREDWINIHSGEPVTHWTVVWDDSPRVWLTYPSHNFVWMKGSWTLLK